MHKKVAWDEAVDEGQLKMGRRAILSQGRHLFGEPPPKIEAALTTVDDPERMGRMLDAILNVKSWKELLAVK